MLPLQLLGDVAWIWAPGTGHHSPESPRLLLLPAQGAWAHGLCWLRTEGIREEAAERSRRLAHEVRSFSQPLRSDIQQEQQADVSRRFSEKNAELLEAGSALFGDI